jgi:hypothetical protein
LGVYVVDPLADPRWDALLLRHQQSAVFHSREWLSALHGTYGYKPIAFTTSVAGGPMENALLFCDVKSWITGQRLVSLPFSDHCDPLLNSPDDHTEIWEHVREYVARYGCKYVEVRPLPSAESERVTTSGLRPSEKHYLHTLSLDPPLDALFSRFHKSCVQRNIRRAEKEMLTYERGRSDSLLCKFYPLLLKTRRRHGLPPQPMQWFRHLIAAMGDRLTIRVACKDDRPVAAILTLAFRDTVTYKYGCSDESFNNLGAMPFLFWKTIQEAKEQGIRQLDLGRSSLDNLGLVRFKDRLGARRMELQYYRFTSGPARTMVPHSRTTEHLKHSLQRLMRCSPAVVRIAVGRILYRHIG